MKQGHLAYAAILFVFASNTWGQNAASTTYSDKEYSGLLRCVGMTDTAWTNAAQKLNGVSLEDARKHYDGKLEGTMKQLALLVVDQVYKDSFTNAWDYAVSFFGECALNMASVGKDRSNLANFCMQNSMIGMTAWEYKSNGQPIETVYQHFANLNGVMPHAIIDRVYVGSKSRADISMDEWKSCMQPLLAQSSPAAPPPGQTIPPLGGLTDQQFEAVSHCVALGETVWAIADQKLKGVRLDDLKKQYDSQPDSPTKTAILKIVDRVYSESFVGAGLYSTRYFDGCALKKPDVTPQHLGVANSCLRNAYIASTASTLKKSGASSDKAYEPFAEFDGTKASTIIDKVYRSSDPGEAGQAEWKACVESSATWTQNQKGQEILLAAIPSGYQVGAQTKTDKVIAQHLYPKGESPNKWTERLSLESFPELFDHTPTQFQKAIQGPSDTCKDGKVISTSVGEQDGYAFSLWTETCAGSLAGKTEFRLNKAIQGHDSLYLVTKSFQSEPVEAQSQQWRSYLSSVKLCDSTRSSQPCPSTDVWRP